MLIIFHFSSSSFHVPRSESVEIKKMLENPEIPYRLQRDHHDDDVVETKSVKIARIPRSCRTCRKLNHFNKFI